MEVSEFFVDMNVALLDKNQAKKKVLDLYHFL